MDYAALILRLTEIIYSLMQQFGAIFSRIETFILLLLHLPTTTSFRVFPPKEASFVTWLDGGDLTKYHAWAPYMILFLVPGLAYSHLKDAENVGLSRLTRVLWRRSRPGALFLCLMRVWFVLAVCDYTLLKPLRGELIEKHKPMDGTLPNFLMRIQLMVSNTEIKRK